MLERVKFKIFEVIFQNNINLELLVLKCVKVGAISGKIHGQIRIWSCKEIKRQLKLFE